MRIYDWVAGAFIAGVAITGGAEAFDRPALTGQPSLSTAGTVEVMRSADAGRAGQAQALVAQSGAQELTPGSAYATGVNAYLSGDKSTAVTALQFAAGKGHAIAQWKLGRMYAEGDGVSHDDIKAFNYFRDIVQSYAAGDPDSMEVNSQAPYVSDALVWLGSYYLEGIPGQVQPNPDIARQLFVDAAFNHGDPNAQYNLARMYLDGTGVKRDPGQAVRLLNLAAQKEHPASRALLGHILFTGDLTRKQAALGLMWLTLAREPAELNARPEDAWIIDLHDKALALATEDERATALAYLERYLSRRN